MSAMADDEDINDIDENSDFQQNQQPSTAIRRACDACRTRKIRCDRDSPCSHCVQAKIPCTHADRRPKEKRTRILLSAQYEKKIDLIDRRLEGVTRLLQEMKTTMPSPGSQSQEKDSPAEKASQQSASPASTPYGHVVQPNSDSPVIEGESSLTAHSAFANEFVQNAVGLGSLQGASLELRDTIDSLHHIIDALKQQTVSTEMTYSMANHVPRPALPGIKLPPIQKTITLMRRARVKRVELGAWLFDLAPLEDFSAICLGVYFSEDYSEADFITANAGMYSLFLESVYNMATPEEKDEFLSYANMCRTNLETALTTLPLHLPATPEMINALLLAAYHAIETSKPSLCWTLTAKAAELCQTLGYHRASTIKDDSTEERERKLYLFWSVYFLDKSLSLRLGRSSNIQEWDISINIPAVGDLHVGGAMSVFIVLWVKTARCQGKIYERLYSPEGASQPDDIRKGHVDAIIKEMETVRSEASSVHAFWLKDAIAKMGQELVKFILISDDVFRLSLMTLAYRASPPPPGSRSPFVPECIEAARATLRRHQDCMAFMQGIHAMYFHAYIHWTLLFAPFTPFIVLFCQVIETQDEKDLASLHSFISTTEFATSVSESAAKMYRLFQVLYSVALRYIEHRTTTPPKEHAQANAELNTYLTALGFPPVGQDQRQQADDVNQDQSGFAQALQNGNVVNGANEQNPMMWMGNTAQLEDWFNSNQQMLELLEEPSFNFPPQ